MPFLHRNIQVGIKLNANEGVAETLDAADYSATLSDWTQNDTTVSDERSQHKGTLSHHRQLKGATIGEWSGMEEMAGGSVSAAARWETWLRVAGFRSPVTLKGIEVGSLTGTEFKPGDVLGNNVARASATKTVRVVGLFVIESDTYLVYEPVTGSALADTDTLHVYDAAGDTVGNRAVATGATPADAGRGYRPLSEDGSTSSPDATMVVRCDGQLHVHPSVRANLEIVLEHGRTAKIRPTPRGPKDLEADGSLEEGGLLSGVAAAAVPIMCGKIGFPFTIDTHSPICTGMTLALGNQLVDRPTISDNGVLGYDGQPMGYMPTRISDRKPMINVGPEHVVKATYDFAGNFDRGDVFRVHVRHGKPTDPSGALVVIANEAQIENNPNRSDRDGITVRDLQLLLTGQEDDEVRVYAVHFDPTA